MSNEELILSWAKKIQALSQSGLTYSKDVYDIERYQELRDLSVEMISTIDQAGDFTDIRKKFAFEEGYATPKVGVRAAVYDQGRVLMVKERDDGLWCLPGGWCDVGDTPKSTVIKEVKEETGYDIEVARLICLFDRKSHNQPPSLFDIYTLVFECNLVGGTPVTSIETECVDFFSEGEIPPLSPTRMCNEQMEIIFQHLKSHQSPYFD